MRNKNTAIVLFVAYFVVLVAATRGKNRCQPLVVGRGTRRRLAFPEAKLGDVVHSAQRCESSDKPLASLKCVEFGGWVYYDTFNINTTECDGPVTEKSKEEDGEPQLSDVTSAINLPTSTQVTPKVFNQTTTSTAASFNFTGNFRPDAKMALDKMVSQVLTQDKVRVKSFESAVSLINNLVSDMTSLTEESSYGRSNSSSNSSDVIKMMESLVDKVDLGSSHALSVDEENFHVQVRNVHFDSNKTSVNFIPNNDDVDSTYFTIPMYVIKQINAASNSPLAQVSFILYKNDDLFVSRTHHTSQVISANIRGNNDNSHLGGSISFSSRFPTLEESERYRLTCGFWNFSLSDWSTTGCSLLNKTGTPRCECNHLTNFAILVDIRKQDNAGFVEEAGSSHSHNNPVSVVVDIISDIGCTLSIIGLILTIIIHLSFRSLRRKRPQQILTHLSISLLFAFTIFELGIGATKRFVVCALIAVLLHYSWLAAWFWMAVEGYTMYYMLVKVMRANIESRFITKSCLFSYGIPAVIVSISSGYCLFYKDVETWRMAQTHEAQAPQGATDYDQNEKHFGLAEEMVVDHSLHGELNWESSYVGRTACWIHGYPLYFGFLLPVGLIIVFNLGTFSAIVYALTKGRKKIQSTLKKQTLIQQLRNLVTMSVLLGLSWSFGFLGLLSSNPTYLQIVHVIHTLLTSVQGFVLFLLFCVRNDVVRRTWVNALRKKLPCLKSPPAPESLTRSYSYTTDGQHHQHRTKGSSAAATPTLSRYSKHSIGNSNTRIVQGKRKENFNSASSSSGMEIIVQHETFVHVA